MDYVGKRIAELRAAAKLSQQKLAKLSGVSQTALSYIELNQKSPSVETLSLICAGLGVTLRDFFGYIQPGGADMPYELQLLLREAALLPPEKVKVLVSAARAMR